MPAFYFNNLHATTCPLYQVPASSAYGFDSAIDNDQLPTYMWVSPNKCDAMYYSTACSNTNAQRRTVGDDWLRNFIPRLTALSSYQTGKTLIILTWDEGDYTKPRGIDCADPIVYTVKSNACSIPTIVLSPYIKPGTIDYSDQSLYTLLGTTEDLLGYQRINGASTHPASMRNGLGF